ncbi:MAG: GNAT family N-acetyltransferase [Pseudomonadota bacterium]
MTPSEQKVVATGFLNHSDEHRAPLYRKELVNWLVRDEQNAITAVLTADVLWDWMYIDELWVSSSLRGEGLGTRLMRLAEKFANERSLQGVWLWTQSWQAEQFYSQLGYVEFTRFDDFPRGHSRIGYRKSLPQTGND